MRILYVGSLHPAKTCYQRMLALRDLGHEVVAVDTDPPSERERALPVRILSRIGRPPDLARANRHIVQYASGPMFDVLWINKGPTIAASTLQSFKQRQPGCRSVCYSGDDMLNTANQSRRYLACVPLYDLHVTTKSYNVSELGAIGARGVLFIDNAYDPHTHKPMTLTEEDRQRWGADVGFIGGFEDDRLLRLRHLAEAGVRVIIRCYSDEWRTCAGVHPNLEFREDETWGENYAKSIAATKINLSFLRKANRDLQTTRSIEIPACGAFMLAERSCEHSALFREGVEAEFFGDDRELLQKTRYYLEHDTRREEVARRGRERCIAGGYSNHKRLEYALSRAMEAACCTK